jgi:hypothetical protein
MKNLIICLVVILLASCCKPPVVSSGNDTTCLNSQLIGKWKNAITNDTITIDSFLINTNQLGYCSDGVNPVHNCYSYCFGKDNIRIQYTAPCKLGVHGKTLTYSLRNDTFRVFKDSVSDPLGVYTNILDYHFIKLN